MTLPELLRVNPSWDRAYEMFGNGRIPYRVWVRFEVLWCWSAIRYSFPHCDRQYRFADRFGHDARVTRILAVQRLAKKIAARP